MRLIKGGKFWTVLGVNNNCFYMSLNIDEALKKLEELKGKI